MYFINTYRILFDIKKTLVEEKLKKYQMLGDYSSNGTIT